MNKLTLSVFALFVAGCVSQPPAVPKAPSVPDVSQFDDLRLCQASADMSPLLSVNPSSHPEYRDNWMKNQAMDKEIARRALICSQVRAAAAPKIAKPLTLRQKRIRVMAVCEDMATRASFANPNVIAQMCQQAAYYTPARCKSDLAVFNRESQTMTGAVRAEYIEISNAVRAGCNLRAR